MVAMPYDAPVTKEPPIGVRLEPDEIAALKAAAKADQRPTSALIRKITTEWLREKGWLAPEAQNSGPKPRGEV